MTDQIAKRRDFDLYFAVAVGGAIGALARYSVDLLLPTATDEWPLATFIINLTGAFVLGCILEAATNYASDPTASEFSRRFRPFLITGVLGGYTTFSTFMVDAHGLVLSGRAPLALLYVFGSLVAGVILVMCGMATGRWMFHRDDAVTDGGHAQEEQIRLLEDEA